MGGDEGVGHTVTCSVAIDWRMDMRIAQAIYYETSGPAYPVDEYGIVGIVVQMQGQAAWWFVWNGEYPA